MGDLDSRRTSSRRLWICAGVASLALHLGGAAFALSHRSIESDDDGLGANAVEIGFEMASPKVPDDDLPAGPDSSASQASPEVAEQKTEVKETDLPKDVPDETSDADRVVTTNDSKKPKEDEAKVAAVQTQASQASENSEESSRKSLEDSAVESEKAKAPNVGIGKDKLRLTANWGRKISAYFELHKRFPAGKNKAAKVRLNLVLNRRGNVVSVDVAESSGDAAYDAAAIAMVRRSDPVPPPPAGLTDDQFSFSLPVDFKAAK
ncbi:TonB family protein [Bradyrhizobium sp. ARR65]|uniref:energy transducer TonB family protein n=1 Tax=Bradyrhizobium sp. ARR65 TaxID=1040989 RepID=UPI00054DCB40|nr:TonB family protein [Bradyrhizobium sp. ARR65]